MSWLQVPPPQPALLIGGGRKSGSGGKHRAVDGERCWLSLDCDVEFELPTRRGGLSAGHDCKVNRPGVPSGLSSKAFPFGVSKLIETCGAPDSPALGLTILAARIVGARETILARKPLMVTTELLLPTRCKRTGDNGWSAAPCSINHVCAASLPSPAGTWVGSTVSATLTLQPSEMIPELYAAVAR